MFDIKNNKQLSVGVIIDRMSTFLTRSNLAVVKRGKYTA